ncbi:MAG: metallophosphoesterase [Cyclobacteriaceae bacterium]
MKIGLLADIHDDTSSLTKALAVLTKEECDQIICLGDITGSSIPNINFYDKDSRNSHEAIQLIRKYCNEAVIGNHDLHTIEKIPNHTGIYKFPKNWYKLDYYSKQKIFKNKVWLYENELPSLIDREDRLFLIGLPEMVFKYYENELGALYSHYAYPDITGISTVKHRNPRYLEKHFKYMDMHKVKLSFSGHNHKEGISVMNKEEKEVVEPGNSFTLDKKTNYWIGIPPVAKSAVNNQGVAVFDTISYELRCLSF